MTGRRVRYHPLDPRTMARVCRKLAQDLRAEAAAGWSPIQLTARANQWRSESISRADAADTMDEQADRWEEEARTGVPNYVDREKIGW